MNKLTKELTPSSKRALVKAQNLKSTKSTSCQPKTSASSVKPAKSNQSARNLVASRATGRGALKNAHKTTPKGRHQSKKLSVNQPLVG